ncbi:MAG: hypothetical protein ACRCX2_30170 [Paraclostridium sp.]
MSKYNRNITPAHNDVYVFQKPVKTVGKYYPVGHIMKGSDYNDPTKMRRGKIKVSEGRVVFFPKIWGEAKSDNPNHDRAQRLQAKLGISTLVTSIVRAQTDTTHIISEPEIKIEAVPRPASTPTRKTNAKKAAVTKKSTIQKEA